MRQLFVVVLGAAMGCGSFATVTAPCEEPECANESESESEPLRSPAFSRMDLIYGSEIGAWDQNGGTATNNSAARQKVIDAKITVIRFSVWGAPYTTQAQWDRFSATIDQIRGLGAIPIIKLPPIYNVQTPLRSFSWIKDIISHAGNRVYLYELFNEPDSPETWGISGTTYANSYWNPWVPALKSYARGLGWEIYIGGPASFSSNYDTVKNQPGGTMYDFLKAVKARHSAAGLTAQQKADLIPDFVSVHMYPNYAVDRTQTAILNRIDTTVDAAGNWKANLAILRNTITAVWGKSLGDPIKIAVSEYNFSAFNSAAARANAADQTFLNQYMTRMTKMFRARDVWLACEFTISSHSSANSTLDLLNPDGSARPLYNAFKARSTTDPVNKLNIGRWGIKANLAKSASFGSIYQSRPVLPNTNYTASVWMNGLSGSVRLQVVNTNWSVVLSSVRANASTGWTKYTVPTFNSGNNTSLTFVIQDHYNDEPAGTVYLDEAFFGTQNGPNLLVNAGFENGDVSWWHGTLFNVLPNP